MNEETHKNPAAARTDPGAIGGGHIGSGPRTPADDVPRATFGPRPASASPEPIPGNLGTLEPKKPVPGTAVMTSPVKRLPPMERLHASEVFPQLFPQPAGDGAPGVFIDPLTGRPAAPRLRDGGQFSLMMLEVGSLFGAAIPQRNVILPMGLAQQEYGFNDTDTVLRMIEVVFDFEDQRDLALKACGKRTKAANPLDRNDPFGRPLSMAPVPSLEPTYNSGRR